jgi:hypothetical protein
MMILTSYKPVFLMNDLLGEVERAVASICALGALILGILNSHKIKEVHVSINSRMDQLLLARSAASMAEGVEQGRNENKTVDDAMKVEIVKLPQIPQDK